MLKYIRAIVYPPQHFCIHSINSNRKYESLLLTSDPFYNTSLATIKKFSPWHSALNIQRGVKCYRFHKCNLSPLRFPSRSPVLEISFNPPTISRRTSNRCIASLPPEKDLSHHITFPSSTFLLTATAVSSTVGEHNKTRTNNFRVSNHDFFPFHISTAEFLYVLFSSLFTCISKSTCRGEIHG